MMAAMMARTPTTERGREGRGSGGGDWRGVWCRVTKTFSNVDDGNDGDNTNQGERDVEAAAVLGEVDSGVWRDVTTISAGRAAKEEGRMGPWAVELKARMLGKSNDADGKHRNEITKMMTEMVSSWPKW